MIRRGRIVVLGCTRRREQKTSDSVHGLMQAGCTSASPHEVDSGSKGAGHKARAAGDFVKRNAKETYKSELVAPVFSDSELDRPNAILSRQYASILDWRQC